MKYYLQNTQGGAYVGNSMKWWAINDKGYTCDLRCAKIWSGEEYEKKNKSLRECDIFWPKEAVDRLVQHHVDWQDLRKNNNGEYPKVPHTVEAYRPDLIPTGFYIDEPENFNQETMQTVIAAPPKENPIQTMLNVISTSGEMERQKYHLTLQGLIDGLMSVAVSLPVRFERGGHPTEFGSYRGYYSDLYFSRAMIKIDVGDFLTVISTKILEETFGGYKGGDYKMTHKTPLWQADYGTTSGSTAITGWKVIENEFVLLEKDID